jgi:hypothetical protein
MTAEIVRKRYIRWNISFNILQNSLFDMPHTFVHADKIVGVNFWTHLHVRKKKFLYLIYFNIHFAFKDSLFRHIVDSGELIKGLGEGG